MHGRYRFIDRRLADPFIRFLALKPASLTSGGQSLDAADTSVRATKARDRLWREALLVHEGDLKHPAAIGPGEEVIRVLRIYYQSTDAGSKPGIRHHTPGHCTIGALE